MFSSVDNKQVIIKPYRRDDIGIPLYRSLNRFIAGVFCSAIFLYVFFGINNYSMIVDNSNIFAANVVNVICYFLILFAFIKWKISPTMMTIITVLYSMIFVALNLYLFWDSTGAFFEFTGSDSYNYHQLSTTVSEMGVIDGIKDYVENTRYDFDDAGFVFYLSVIYWLTDSILLERLINILLNAVSVVLIYKISKRFIIRKLAIITSISYGIASFTIYYQSSGLKEILMITLLLISYYLYYHFTDRRTVLRGGMFILVTSILMFFRIPLVIFIFLSVAITEFINRRGLSFGRLIVTFLALSAVLGVGILQYDKLEQYTRRFNTPLRIDAAEKGLERPSVSLFMRSTAMLAGIFGPFPSVVPLDNNQDTVMHGPGLILKVFLSSYFIFGVFFAFRRKIYLFLPLILFCLMHIVSLSYLVHTFKIRNVLPYFPFFFLIAYYGFQMVICNQHPAVRQSVFLTNFFVIILISRPDYNY